VTVALVLPWPPSANSLWRAVKGRNIMSARYRDWQYEAGQCVGLQNPPNVKGPVNLTIELTPPDRRRIDLDNRLKAVIDLLVKHRVIEADDNTVVRQIVARWVDNDNECTVFVEAA
jgi:crossover junction endodeoxyribonuclease RusA